MIFQKTYIINSTKVSVANLRQIRKQLVRITTVVIKVFTRRLDYQWHSLTAGIFACVCVCVCVWAFAPLLKFSSVLRVLPLRIKDHIQSIEKTSIAYCVRRFNSSLVSIRSKSFLSLIKPQHNTATIYIFIHYSLSKIIETK